MPENKRFIRLVPLRFYRRQLHALQPAAGGIRRNYGGTRSLGFKRGSFVKYLKHGVCFVGGSSKGKISLHRIGTGRRFSQNVKITNIKFLTYSTWRMSIDSSAS